ncbi:hypothetical protein [Halorussus sp. MSC15.2]|uniref:hypothetical protein n=1 Tax=Halorussus sp. MSC15.2 TaxID=2283638 RepID=UPI0013D3ACBD|nr:hypothetical protein [Halorussus sp. MSC15.2]NEU57744.1 hypothetical protein [Halorussus sp. MSC15.2]
MDDDGTGRRGVHLEAARNLPGWDLLMVFWEAYSRACDMLGGEDGFSHSPCVVAADSAVVTVSVVVWVVFAAATSFCSCAAAGAATPDARTRSAVIATNVR